MRTRGHVLSFGVALSALSAVGPLDVGDALAGDFMDTTITFVAGDDNVLAGAGETNPSSPGPDLRPRSGNALFFENYNSRNTGEETRGQLVLYKEFQPYFARVVPEAAMVLQWDANRMARDGEQVLVTGSQRPTGGLKDDGSYLAIHFDGTTPSPDVKPHRLSLILFPFDSDRVRLGYSWELTWGGRSSFLLAPYTPGLMVSYKAPAFYAFGAAKTARTQWFTQSETDPHRDESETIYGVLGGGGLHVTDQVLVDLSFGYFQKGTIPTDRGELEGTWVDQYGASTQLTWHDGIEPKVPVDTKLLRNLGGDLKVRDWKPRKLGYLVSTEFTATSQRLENTDAAGTSARETGMAGDINAAMQSGRMTFNLDVIVRSLEFLVQDTPGFSPYATVSEAITTSPEIFASVGADYAFPELRFVPGVAFGVQRPAVARISTTQRDGSSASANIVVRKTKNVLGESQVLPTALPIGEAVSPVFAGKLYLREYLSDLIFVAVQAQVTFDDNLVTNDPDSGARKFESPMILGLNLIAQAKF